ncbi:MAG: Mov34/MPN/PAD-1 family protein [Thermodesulfobacteriota bacterium]
MGQNMHMKATMSEEAFLGLMLSSIEVYKRECLGLLLGYRMKEGFVIEYAIPYQAAERGHGVVDVLNKYHRRLQTALAALQKWDLIGDFHSHPQYRNAKGNVSPSKEDIRDIQKNSIFIIVAINDRKKRQHFEMNKDGTISGVLGEHHIKIACFCKEKENSIHPVHLTCQFATGLYAD